MSKQEQIAQLASKAGLAYVHYKKGQYPGKKSAVWEFRHGSSIVATFTSPSRIIQWLKVRTGDARQDEGRQD